MFGLSWTEIALIGVVAMVLIGPKDLPIAVKAVAEMVKKARRMAGEFQGHVDEMMRDSNLKEVRDSISEIRRMDIAGDIRRHVDADGSLKAALTDDPFRPAPNIAATPLAEPGASESGTLSMEPASMEPASMEPASMERAAPAFIPPPAADAEAIAGVDWGGEPAPPAAPAPAFIPPEAARPGH